MYDASVHTQTLHKLCAWHGHVHVLSIAPTQQQQPGTALDSEYMKRPKMFAMHVVDNQPSSSLSYCSHSTPSLHINVQQ